MTQAELAEEIRGRLFPNALTLDVLLTTIDYHGHSNIEFQACFPGDVWVVGTVNEAWDR